MKAVVDHGLGQRARHVIIDCLAQRLAAVLGRESKDRSRSAEYGCDSTGIEVVGDHHTERAHLLDVAMALHASGKDELSRGIDFTVTITEAAA